MGCQDIGGVRLPRDRTPLEWFRAGRCFYIRIGLNVCRAVMPDAPPDLGDYTTDLRLGTSVDLVAPMASTLF